MKELEKQHIDKEAKETLDRVLTSTLKSSVKYIPIVEEPIEEISDIVIKVFEEGLGSLNVGRVTYGHAAKCVHHDLLNVIEETVIVELRPFDIFGVRYAIGRCTCGRIFCAKKGE